MSNTPNIPALIGSRICHDLINPLGAIGNGLELLTLSGVPEGPEMALVSESVANATAKVKMMRIAFGDAAPDQMVARSDITETLAAITAGGRLGYVWNVAEDAARLDVRVALLAAMCVETALPMGGDIVITKDGNAWSVYAQHERLSLDPALWQPVSKGQSPNGVLPAQVHFALLPDMAAKADCALVLTHGLDWVKISF
ncbi:MAG: histidine phosphotransferase [Octadecabacter sp.]|nr:histidine phosphotransferase [Octadecabacter sp.]